MLYSTNGMLQRLDLPVTPKVIPHLMQPSSGKFQSAYSFVDSKTYPKLVSKVNSEQSWWHLNVWGEAQAAG
jgi:hypothetical protein